MKTHNLKKKRTCPKCGSEKVKKIVYGLMEPEDLDKLEDDVVPGGCIVGPWQFRCGDCEWEW